MEIRSNVVVAENLMHVVTNHKSQITDLAFPTITKVISLTKVSIPTNKTATVSAV